jgi:hypothetical protein
MKAQRFARVAVGLLSIALGRGASAADALEATAKSLNTVSDTIDQGSAELVGFDKIRTPASPAFAILGVSPTEIQRPGTPAGLAAAFSSFIAGKDSFVPQNLSLEVSPYWLYSHPSFTSGDYETGGLANLWRTFSLSLGTKKSSRQTIEAGQIVAHDDAELAIGARTRVFSQFAVSDECLAQRKNLASAAIAVGEQFVVPQGLIAGKSPEEAEKIVADEQARFTAAKKEAIEALERARKTLDLKCVDVMASARGFSIDAAGAFDVFFADARFTKSASDLHAAAGWLTLAYGAEHWSLLGLGRYQQRKVITDWQRVFDFGARFAYKRNRLALSGEGLGRIHLSGPASRHYKVDVAGEVELRDGVWLTITFGKEFEGAQAGALFSLANLNWGFGSSPTAP